MAKIRGYKKLHTINWARKITYGPQWAEVWRQIFPVVPWERGTRGDLYR